MFNINSLTLINGEKEYVYNFSEGINYFRGKYLVIINQSDLDVRRAENTLIIRERIGKVFTELAKLQGIEL